MATLSSSIGIIGAPVSHLPLTQLQRKKTDVVDVLTIENGVTEYTTAEGCGPIGVQRCLRSLYDEEVIYISSIRGWVRHFKNGGKDIADRNHSGLPVTAATTEAEDEF
jgi:hypothetical protein